MKPGLVALLVVGLASRAAADEDVRLHLEIDPLPFALGGHGVQAGVRVRDVRVAIANFSLDVPDFAAQLGGNDGFHLRVRPTPAVYVLYYYKEHFAIGGSVRFLRLRYSHDDVEGHMDTVEVSPEAIVGYKWHPTKYGFFLQPWLGLSTTVWRSDEPVVGDRRYDPLPIQLFFTVNLGWELVL